MSLGTMIDSVVGTFAPMAQVRRQHARRLLRSYSGAEANRLTANKKPRNLSADNELLGPFGADSMRAWARMLVRDNAYAWGVVDTIVSSVVGCGIKAQSMYETPAGDDVESVNLARDAIWQEWCEVCDINGQFSWCEMQQIIQREIVEAGECLVHLVTVPRKFKGINRPVPLALELIEADRLASDQDTYAYSRESGNRVIRGVEIDELGKPIAYWIHPEHPNSPYARNRNPVRIQAADIRHLFRRDRIGQSRGVSWFAPVMSWLRDLGVYVDNEIQASAVASCFAVAIKTTGPVNSLAMPTEDSSNTDSNGNQFEYLEPGIVAHLQPGEDISTINPGRPNSNSEPWINLMLRGISVGTGLSYEIVARDYSQTSYSSSRTSQLEDRRRFRRWQAYLVNHLCQPVWDRFCDAAAIEGRDEFPPMADLLEDRRKYAAVEWQTPEWEWVDPQNEQAASQASIDAYQSTYQEELGARGRNWRTVFYQRAKEESLKKQLGLIAPEVAQAQAQADAQAQAQAAGDMMGLSRLQWKNNRKAIDDTLNQLAAKEITPTKAQVMLQAIGLNPDSIATLINDATDGTVDITLPTGDEPQPAEMPRSLAVKKKIERDCGTGAGGFKPGNSCAGEGGGGGGGGKPAPKSFSDSEVKDDDGNLLELYHGTSGDFEEFNNDAKGISTGGEGTDEGFFFSESKDHAEYWAGQSENKVGGTAKVKTVNLNAKKVLTVPESETSQSAYPIRDAIEKAREGDYDAIKFEGLVDDESGTPRTTWFVFDADQIHTKKTAEVTDHDINDPNIGRSLTRDCGTGAGGFKPGNKCAGEGDGESGGANGGEGEQAKVSKAKQAATSPFVGGRKHVEVKQFSTHAEMEATLSDALSSAPSLDESEIQARKEAVKKVVSKMPTAAVEHVGKTVKVVTTCGGLGDVSEQFTEITGAKVEEDDVIGGLWSTGSGRLTVDGGFEDENFEDSGSTMTKQGILAHEIGHALDTVGGKFTHSKSKEFSQAFKKEIAGGQLSDYAATDEQEGFAEFARLIYSSDTSHDEIGKAFPLTTQFFKKRGLM